LLFLGELSKLNLVVHEGKIIDASFVEVPKQRNSREENAEIKKGLIPASISANPHVLSQMVAEPAEVKIQMRVGRRRAMQVILGIKTI
jgi:hypothetical protein